MCILGRMDGERDREVCILGRMDGERERGCLYIR